MEHVGGHSNKSWTDKGALKALNNKIAARDFLDIGCGPGGQIAVARELGIDAYGLDGDPKFKDHPYIQVMDFSKTKAGKDNVLHIPKKGYFDIGWSTEFLEHVDAEFLPNFMPAFALCRYVVITHATPGQGGYHHVNEQLFKYWKEEFEKYGLVESRKLTKRVRASSTMRCKKLNHFIKFDEDGNPVNVKKRSSFMIKTGRVLINKNF